MKIGFVLATKRSFCQWAIVIYYDEHHGWKYAPFWSDANVSSHVGLDGKCQGTVVKALVKMFSHLVLCVVKCGWIISKTQAGCCGDCEEAAVVTFPFLSRFSPSLSLPAPRCRYHVGKRVMKNLTIYHVRRSSKVREGLDSLKGYFYFYVRIKSWGGGGSNYTLPTHTCVCWGGGWPRLPFPRPLSNNVPSGSGCILADNLIWSTYISHAMPTKMPGLYHCHLKWTYTRIGQALDTVYVGRNPWPEATRTKGVMCFAQLYRTWLQSPTIGISRVHVYHSLPR